MVSNEAKVLLLSNIKKESIKGLSTFGIVSGKDNVNELIYLISKYLYSLVTVAWSPDSSIFLALMISFSKNEIISLIFLDEANSVVNSSTF